MVNKANPQVQPKPERRRFNAEYKRRIVLEAEACEHGELGSLLRRPHSSLGYLPPAVFAQQASLSLKLD
jgi:transposase InsO family protein